MSKINAAESIRGLACLAVVFSHLILTFFPLLHTNTIADIEKMSSAESFIYNSPFGFLYSGSAAVFIFFVLSGYVLSYAILSKKDVNQKILTMSVKRYPRLAIPALLSCLIAYFVLFIAVDKSNVSQWFGKYGTIESSFFGAVYQGTVGSFIFGSSHLNWVLWTMQIELFGSFIVFFLLYLHNKKKGNAAFLISSVIVSIVSLAVSFTFALGVVCFIVGIFLYLYGKKIPTLLTLPCLLIGLYLAGVHSYSTSYNLFNGFLGDKTYILLNILSGPLIVFGILMNPKISELMDRKLLVILGKLSFSIYLLHLIVIYAFGVPLFNLLLSNNISYVAASFFASLVIISLSIIFSFFYSKYVDDLSIRVGAKIESLIKNQLVEKSSNILTNNYKKSSD